jgi:hypothetical protein
MILWSILERCAREAEGYPLEATHPLVVGLIADGLIVLRADGRAVTTEKGKEVLAELALASSPKGIDDEAEAQGRGRPDKKKS